MFICYEAPRQGMAARKIDVYENGEEIGLIEETRGRAYGPKELFTVRAWSNAYARFDFVGHASCVADAKLKLKKHGYDFPKKKRPETASVAYLPAGDSCDFYPTPSAIAGRMFAKVKWNGVSSILEPSAGKGDLVDCLKLTGERWTGRRKFGVDKVDSKVDVIERDNNLRFILRGKGYRLIADDFLTFTTEKRYDLILMNPPFSNGDEHLLRAIDLMQNGGQIVCLLNAETIRKPYTNRRRVLLEQLSKYDAQIEFIRDGFKRAQRKTGVEIALIYMNIPAPRKTSNIFENMRKAEGYTYEQGEATALIGGNDIHQLIQLYNMEAKSGIALMEEYAAIAPFIKSGIKDDSGPLIRIEIGRDHYSTITSDAVNNYLRALRSKFWETFLDRPEIKEKLTSAMAQDYRSKVDDMANYDFNEHNIMQVLFDIQMQLSQGVEDSIMALFDKFTEKHSWYPECENNIHYYNGWKTNKAHKIGKKVIIPIHGCCCDRKWNRNTLDRYNVYKFILDLERAMNFLDKGETTFRANIDFAISRANAAESNKADFTYFTATFYKKGTCHIRFKDEAAKIIDRLNIFAARQRAWLPPNYGKKSYEQMNKEEQAVIDDFQGQAAYEEVFRDPGAYILDGPALVALPSA